MDCSRKKEYPQSEKYLEEAILIWTKLTGPNSRQVAEEKDYLADTLRYEKKYQAAESLIREAMKSREKIFGADCAESAWSMQILAEICIANGRFEEAENLLKKCIEIRQGKDPERDYLVAGHEISLGQLYLKEEKFELAQGCFERALAIKEHNQTRSAENAKIMQDLAKCYRHEGNDVRAREIENESSKIMKSLGQTP
jgi:tetratricopeptide (TPR) repeat protein